MIKNMTEYVSCEFQTSGLFRQSVGMLNHKKPAEKKPRKPRKKKKDGSSE